MTHSIPFTHNGIDYRSLTEARWGAFFGAAGYAFSYEPSGYNTTFGPYLPDFVLHDAVMGDYWSDEPVYRGEVIVEVKASLYQMRPNDVDRLIGAASALSAGAMLVTGQDLFGGEIGDSWSGHFGWWPGCVERHFLIGPDGRRAPCRHGFGMVNLEFRQVDDRPFIHHCEDPWGQDEWQPHAAAFHARNIGPFRKSA